MESVPTVTPTMEQMNHLLDFIMTQRDKFRTYGAIIIQPPSAWSAPAPPLQDHSEYTASFQYFPQPPIRRHGNTFKVACDSETRAQIAYELADTRQ